MQRCASVLSLWDSHACAHDNFERSKAAWLVLHPQNINLLQVEAMQRHPAKDILEEEEDGKYTKSGAQLQSMGQRHCAPLSLIH